MDYEKKYKEALERAKAIIKVAANQNEAIDFANTIFPELVESEDKRIRKFLTEDIKDTLSSEDFKHYNPEHTKKLEEALAWLEKQGKQKVSYTTTVETGDGGINALVTRELPTDGCDDEQKPTDLEEFISELSKQFPDVSFAKLSRIAVRTAKWAKPAWSEEDKEHIIDIIDYLDDYYSFAKDEYEDVADGVLNEIRWLQHI